MKNILFLLATITLSSCAETETYSSIKAENFPLISQAPEFREMEVSSSIKDTYDLTPEVVASRLWDFANTCKGCRYDLPYMNEVNVFKNSDSELYVWQHIKKGIWVFSINSFSFLKANQYRSADGSQIIIDTMTPKLALIESLSLEHDLKHDASFDSIHIRMIINKTAEGSELEIKVTAIPRGIAAKAPTRILRSELKGTTEAIARSIK